MKRLLEVRAYREDVARVASLDLPWGKLRDKTVLLTGGTGLIGSFLVDVLQAARLGCRLLLLGRSEGRARARFREYWTDDTIRFVKWDAAARTLPPIDDAFDFVLHLASNTHPVAYATDPVGTITTNVIALNNLLDCAVGVSRRSGVAPRFLFASSNEIYGENRGDIEFFDEQSCGYIDCNTLRAGYPEAKRCGEALCQAYIRQFGLDCVVARLTRTFGPTILDTDTKAVSQFFKNALASEDIVLKSEGLQHFSYQYVADSVAGLLTVLLKGDTGAAYNIADVGGDIRLRDLAALIAGQVGRRVIFKLPGATEAAGFSKATKARLCGDRLKALGWRPNEDIASGIRKNLAILKEMQS